MSKIIYAMQFKGFARPQVAAGTTLKAVTKGASCQVQTTVGPDGLRSSMESAAGEEAAFESTVVFKDTSTFDEKGAIRFGDGNQLHFETIGIGYLGPVSKGVRHGCVSWRVVAGEGQFAHATGIITSNFTVSESGEVIDNHLGVLDIRNHAMGEPQTP